MLKNKTAEIKVKYPTILVVGARRQGKTTFISELQRKIPANVRIVFTMNEDNAEHYKKLGFIASAYTPEMLEVLRDDYGEISKLIVFDDCIDQSTIKFDSLIQNLFTMGRHMKATVIYATQDIKCIHPTWRKNLDYLFCFGLRYGTDREYIAQNYIEGLMFDSVKVKSGESWEGIGITKKEAAQIIFKLPKYHCLACDFTVDSTYIKDICYICTAKR